MLRSKLPLSALSLALLAASGAACEIERNLEREGGMHPPGFADRDQPDFHQKYLRAEYIKNKRGKRWGARK